MTKSTSTRAQLSALDLQLMIATIETVCQMLLALKPILDGLVKETAKK